MSNFGDDLFLSIDNDLIISSNGDYMCTSDYEKTISDLPFEGYVCLRETIARMIQATAGEYSVFDINFGAGIEELISTTDFNNKFNQFKERLQTSLLNDDRVKYVERIEYEKIDINTYNIYVSIITVGSNVSSKFVFPYVV